MSTPSLPTPARTVPLTEVQQQVWLMAQLGPAASVASNESLTIELAGPLDLAALRAALQTLIDRHEALRASFSADGTQQLIAAPYPVTIPLLDFVGLTTDEQRRQLSDWRTAEATTPFDFQRGPLFRLWIIRLEPLRHLLVFSVHQIIFDTWSLSVFQRELGLLYSAHVRGLRPELPPAAQYGAYATAQAQQIAAGALVSAERYWTTRFAAAPPELVLPMDRPRPAIKSYAADCHNDFVATAEYQQLTTFSAQHGTTLYATLLSSFNLLLHYLAQHNDLAVGIHLVGQHVAQQPDLVGLCINLLPFRSTLTDDPALADYLAATDAQLQAAAEHQSYPFGRLIRALQLRRDPARLPLLSVMFHLEPQLYLQLDGLEVVEVSGNSNNALTWDLRLVAIEGDGLRLEWKYNADLFDTQTIEGWMMLYRRLLTALVAQPDLRWSALTALLSEAQRQQQAHAAAAIHAARQQKFQTIKRRLTHPTKDTL